MVGCRGTVTFTEERGDGRERRGQQLAASRSLAVAVARARVSGSHERASDDLPEKVRQTSSSIHILINTYYNMMVDTAVLTLTAV